MDWYAATRVAVAPLLAGGGSRLKILEALAAARPLVATTVGAEGLEDLVGRGVVVADAPADLAREVVTVRFDPAMVDGVLRWDTLHPTTQRDWLRAGAAVARGL